MLDGAGDDAGHRGGLAPTDFELLVMQVDLAEDHVGVKSIGHSRGQERDEGARLFGQDLNAFNGTKAHKTQKLVNGSNSRKIA